MSANASMEVRYASHPSDVKNFDTDRLRREFLMDNLMQRGKVHTVYSHYDRVITGGAVPLAEPLELPTFEPLKAEYFLERREAGIINVGGKGSIIVDGKTWDLEHKECLYIGKGAQKVLFMSADAAQPAMFYIVSSPAHASYPTAHMTLEQAVPMDLGTMENANQRTVYKFIHKDGIQSAQLVMGMTVLKPGNIWNTMPCHHHDRRMEVYYYFDLPADAKVMHFMGQFFETRHLVVGNNMGIISPPWSIHSGAGTAAYTFIWAMAGENYTYTDMDFVTMDEIR